MIVLLDTNALLLPHQHGIDVFSEISRIMPEKYELITLSTVIDELKGLSRQQSADGAAAKVGLRLLEDKHVKIVPSTGGVDEALVEYAGANRAIVCTNDKELKRRLKAKGAQILSMRGKTHMELR
jgi:rRNA-processing protein FCF1